MFDNISPLKIMSLLCFNQKIKLIVMSKKYVELSGSRLAEINYGFEAHETSELFKELKDDDVIPEELWEDKPISLSIEFIYREHSSKSNLFEAEDTYLIYNAIHSLTPPINMTVAKYFS